MKKVVLILLSVTMLLVSCVEQTTITTEQTDSYTESLTESPVDIAVQTKPSEETTEPIPNTPIFREHDSVEEAYSKYQKLYVDCDYQSCNYYVDYDYDFGEYYALIFTDIDDFGMLIYAYEGQNRHYMQVLSFYAFGKVIETESLENGVFDMIYFFGDYIKQCDDYILYNGGYGVDGHYGYKYFLIMHQSGYYEITHEDMLNHIGIEVGATVSYENGEWHYLAQNARWIMSNRQESYAWAQNYISADEYMMEVGTFSFDESQIMFDTEQSYTVDEWLFSEYGWWEFDQKTYDNSDKFVAAVLSMEIW